MLRKRRLLYCFLSKIVVYFESLLDFFAAFFSFMVMAAFFSLLCYFFFL